MWDAEFCPLAADSRRALMSALGGKRTLGCGPPFARQTKSVEKVPCSECGVLILPATAESTGGLCMACKQGIRKSMKASRAYFESLKQCDPFRELWRSLVKKCSNDPGLSQFSIAEQRYLAVSLLEGESTTEALTSSFGTALAIITLLRLPDWRRLERLLR